MKKPGVTAINLILQEAILISHRITSGATTKPPRCQRGRDKWSAAVFTTNKEWFMEYNERLCLFVCGQKSCNHLLGQEDDGSLYLCGEKVRSSGTIAIGVFKNVDCNIKSRRAPRLLIRYQTAVISRFTLF